MSKDIPSILPAGLQEKLKNVMAAKPPTATPPPPVVVPPQPKPEIPAVMKAAESTPLPIVTKPVLPPVSQGMNRPPAVTEKPPIVFESAEHERAYAFIGTVAAWMNNHIQGSMGDNPHVKVFRDKVTAYHKSLAPKPVVPKVENIEVGGWVLSGRVKPLIYAELIPDTFCAGAMYTLYSDIHASAKLIRGKDSIRKEMLGLAESGYIEVYIQDKSQKYHAVSPAMIDSPLSFIKRIGKVSEKSTGYARIMAKLKAAKNNEMTIKALTEAPDLQGLPMQLLLPVLWAGQLIMLDANTYAEATRVKLNDKWTVEYKTNG